MKIQRIQTEDGYIFYVLPDGKVVDNLNPELVDLSFESLEKMLNDPYAPNITFI